MALEASPEKSLSAQQCEVRCVVVKEAILNKTLKIGIEVGENGLCPWRKDHQVL